MFRQKVLKERMKAANHRMDDLNCEKGKRPIFVFDFINDPRVAAVCAKHIRAFLLSKTGYILRLRAAKGNIQHESSALCALKRSKTGCFDKENWWQ